jgi:hypothetical protein
MSKAQDEERRRARTSFSPSWCGANSTARTVPFASASTARSTQRVPGPLAAVDAPFVCGWSVFSAGISSHTFTVRSNDELARTEPNSGCAHDSFVTAAPWAWQHMLSREPPWGCEMSTHLPVCHGRPRSIRLVELPDFYAVVEGAGRETDTIEVVCSVGYEISVCALY